MTLGSFLATLIGRRADNTVLNAQRSVSILRVMNVDVLAGRTAVICEGVTGLTTVLVPAVPTAGQAQRWRRLLRVDRVELEIAGSDVRATIHGVGHRLPMRREVPVSVALSLLDDGIAGRVVIAKPCEATSDD